VSRVRSLARSLAASALGLALRLTARRQGLVLVYHALGRVEGDPARELVPPHSAAAFEAHLRHLASRYRIVAADELLAAASERRRGGRFPVAVTFDDDLPSHRAVALPILGRAGVRATFFLCGASLDRPFAFWWERLQEAVDAAVAPGADGVSVHELADRVEEMPPGERDAFAAELERRLPPPPDDSGLRADDVRALVSGGQAIGFHTLRHERLPPLEDEALAAAFKDGREALEAIAGRIEAVAYPHGRADERVAAAARAAGYRFGFTGRPCAVDAESDPLLLGRVEPTRVSTASFALQLVRVLARGG
jgi:peptidoglycan/xylan/chitin deacetylase (PgdA/CDA1 family)